MANKKKIFTKEDIQAIIVAYSQNESCDSIAVRYGYAAGSRKVIAKVLENAGVSLRTYRPRTETVKDGKKLCRICNEWIVLDKFFKRTWKGKPSTEFSYCKDCSKTAFSDKKYYWHIGNKYNISTEEYLLLLKSQNDCCAICKKSPNKLKQTKGCKTKLVIDHDHVTGKIRGLLCDNCNKAIGQFQEN